VSRQARSCGAALALLLLAGCGAPAAPTAPPANRVATAEAAARPNTARDFAAGRWLDLTHAFDAAKCAADPVYEVTADDFVAWEERHGRQLVDVIVLLRTGWAGRWGDREAYLGTAATGADAVPQLRFPGLSPEAAKWLVEHRRVKAVGIDTASIDHGPSTLFGSHVALCSANTPIFENVADLAALPAEGAFVAALPMKIAGGSGGPLRILARLPE